MGAIFVCGVQHVNVECACAHRLTSAVTQLDSVIHDSIHSNVR